MEMNNLKTNDKSSPQACQTCYMPNNADALSLGIKHIPDYRY